MSNTTTKPKPKPYIGSIIWHKDYYYLVTSVESNEILNVSTVYKYNIGSYVKSQMLSFDSIIKITDNWKLVESSGCYILVDMTKPIYTTPDQYRQRYEESRFYDSTRLFSHW